MIENQAAGCGAQPDARAQALLDALNDLFVVAWTVTPATEFYCFRLALPAEDDPFVYERSIRPGHINGEPFRVALHWADEVCERYGRHLLLRPDVAQETVDEGRKVGV